jgi:hypothetical protein
MNKNYWKIRARRGETFHPKEIMEMLNKLDELEANNQWLTDLTEWAWTIIANVNGGNWMKSNKEWVDAAIYWRDEYNLVLHGQREDEVMTEAERMQQEAYDASNQI